MYCQFEDDENFEELYEMKADPWQLQNVAYENSTDVKAVLEAMQVRHVIRLKCSQMSSQLDSTLKIPFDVLAYNDIGAGTAGAIKKLLRSRMQRSPVIQTFIAAAGRE